MVEIINQRKAFLDMLAWSEESDTGRQASRNAVSDVVMGKGDSRCRDYLITLANLSR